MGDGAVKKIIVIFKKALLTVMMLVLISSNTAYCKEFSEEESNQIINDFFGNIELIRNSALPDPDELQKIIDSGVDLNYQGKEGAPSTLYRLQNIGHISPNQSKEGNDSLMTQMLKMLLAGGLEINDSCIENMYSSIVDGMTNFIDTLISNGCDLVTKKVNIGSGSYPELINAIDLADKYGHDDLVKVFLKHGAKLQSPDIRAQYRLVGGAKTQNNNLIIESIHNHAAINGKDIFGDNALIALAGDGDFSSQGGLDTLNLLLKFGARPSIARDDSGDILNIVVKNFYFYCNHLDCGKYDTIILQRLIDSGALVSSKSGLFGRTPLHIAAEKNYYEATRVLIENGAKVMVLDDTRKTPLNLAENGKIIKLLKDNGAIERGF